ncbi:Protein strubbelig-receptor family 3 [Apostasia shenzhenica]|uniref:Protein strubbelig-receptor family 3 n=1 Tax=Apostasia shenzhenica TaxID=1088818 RepID=A0A2I0A9L7_9ASPA|nr:Protein strubbelig-receptor family 3 [Apostasia shenzhenica]
MILSYRHIQNNHLFGTLDVLEDLPLMDLDIENNLFSGPVPVKLWNIPNFRSKGNPFNTTVAPYTSPPLALPPSVAHDPSHSTDAPSPSTDALSTGRGGNTSNRSVIVFVVVALIIVITVPLVMCYLSKCREKKLEHGCMPKSRKKLATEMSKEPLRNTNSVPSKNSGHTPGTHEECNAHIMESSPVLSSHLAEKIDIEKHFVHPGKEKHDLSFKKARPPTENLTLPDSVACFSVGILQQYTNYFAEKHLIRSMHLGKLYLAKVPNGQLLTVMKLDNLTSNINVNEFHELALRASNIRHQNVVELVGYCFEFGQRLFIFSYFSRRTLYDLLHCYDFVDKRLSWNARIKIALDSARALEYLHESCQPPVILKSFEPACILLDDRLAVRISEFGLVSYVFSSSNCQFAGDSTEFSGYEAPEISDSGCFTDRSDVYSFGVVMLELLTGRPAYDSFLSSQSRSEKHLVRWASPQLYDINALSRMVDPSMDGVVSLKSLSRFADIISRCIQQSPEFRPAMSQIVQDLNLVLNGCQLQ